MNKLLSHHSYAYVLIALLSGLIFIPFIGQCPLFDWDEVNFAECAREMLVSGNYAEVQLHFKPFWEKPPFFIWLQAASMHMFGINEFAARFPNAVCSILSMVALFYVGKRYHSARFGYLWCLLYAASLLPHFYFKSGIIDPWFNLFIFLSLYQSFQFLHPRNVRHGLINALLAGLFLGLAVLTKGPAALVISALSIVAYLLWTKSLRLLWSGRLWLFVIATLFVAGSWFMAEWLSGHQNVVKEFIDYQIRLFETGDAGHDGPFLYHALVLLLGCFPASILFMMYYNKTQTQDASQLLFRKLMLCLFWVVLILFSVVKTKIIHYSSLCYYPLTFVACIGLVDLKQERVSPYLKTLYWFTASLLILAFLLIGLFPLFRESLLASGLIGDAFAVENLKADVKWSGLEFLPGLVLLSASVLLFRALKNGHAKQLYLALGIQTAFITLAILLLVPKIEQYTQHAAIAFYREKAKEHCYIETHNFKSYAYLFYGDRRPGDFTNPDQVRYIFEQQNVMEREGHSRLSSYATSNVLWMENGKIDRTAYIVIKTPDEKKLMQEHPDFTKLYQKNGFSFFARYPDSPVK